MSPCSRPHAVLQYSIIKRLSTPVDQVCTPQLFKKNSTTTPMGGPQIKGGGPQVKCGKAASARSGDPRKSEVEFQKSEVEF